MLKPRLLLKTTGFVLETILVFFVVNGFPVVEVQAALNAAIAKLQSDAEGSAGQNQPGPTPSASDDDLILEDSFSIDDAASLWVVVNKLRALRPADYVPPDIFVPEFDNQALTNPENLLVSKRVYQDLLDMTRAMKEAGAGEALFLSGYRSFERQQQVFDVEVANLGLAGALVRIAKPGHSEHQTGLAVDLGAAGQGCNLQQCFGQTLGGRWLVENSWKYGFIVRYPDGYKEVTGYEYEPWHFRYLGRDLAARFIASGKPTLEEFWGLPAAPRYPEEG